MSAEIWARLREDAAAVACARAELVPALSQTVLAVEPAAGLAALLARLIRPVFIEAGEMQRLAERAFRPGGAAAEAALADLDYIAHLNYEPGGMVGTWLGGRGFHMLLAHRVAHELWFSHRQETAMAYKTAAAALGADIHPAARIGQRIFLDHGIGVVIGETAIVEDEVCIWHGVTLGSTLMEAGDRHPKIRRGAVLGAGATILGNIEIGAGAVVAAGSVVLRSVPANTTVAGNPARPKAKHRHPYQQETPHE